VDISKLHVDQALTNLSIGYQNGEFVAEQVFPPLPVDKQSNKYFVHDMERFRSVDDHRRPGQAPTEIDWTLSTDSYYCDGHGRRDVIPVEDMGNADEAVDLEITSTETLTDQIYLAREVNLVTALAAAMSPTALTAARWDVDSNDPIPVVEAAKETIQRATGKRPNCLLLSRPVFRGAHNNASVVGRITGARSLTDSLVTPDQLRDLFEVDNLIIADAVKLTSMKGQTNALDFIWGKYALLFYRPPAMGRKVMALGATFRWNVLGAAPANPDAQGGVGQFVEKWYSQDRKATMVDACLYYDQKLISAGAGVMWSDCVS
jgi:hypothetical protein